MLIMVVANLFVLTLLAPHFRDICFGYRGVACRRRAGDDDRSGRLSDARMLYYEPPAGQSREHSRYLAHFTERSRNIGDCLPLSY